MKLLCVALFLVAPQLHPEQPVHPRPRVPYECPGMSGATAAAILRAELVCDTYFPESKAQRLQGLEKFQNNYPGCYEELKGSDEFQRFQASSRVELSNWKPSPEDLSKLKNTCSQPTASQDEFNRSVESTMPPSPKPRGLSSKAFVSTGEPYPQARANLLAQSCSLPALQGPRSNNQTHKYFREISCDEAGSCSVEFKCPDLNLRVNVVVRDDGVFVGPDGI